MLLEPLGEFEQATEVHRSGEQGQLDPGAAEGFHLGAEGILRRRARAPVTTLPHVVDKGDRLATLARELEDAL